MDFSFKTLTEFTDHFNTEAKCYEYLEQKWWDGAPRCPKCGSAEHYKVKSRTKFDVPTYRCAIRSCDKPYTVKTGSIFEGTQVELRKWFMAMYELVTSKKGISSVELATRIGVSQKCAWLMNHKIRQMLGDTDDNTPMGEGGQMVEVDESYPGGKVINMTEGKRRKIRNGEIDANANKSTVMGYLERGGRLKLEVLDKRKDVRSAVLRSVSPEAVLMTDAHQVYTNVGKSFAAHEVVNHANREFVRDGIFHTNGIEGAFSILDRAIMGIFHYVSPKHLQKYCDEISLKYNGRGVHNLYRFQQIVENARVERITYRNLTK